jgi:signal transduction histidine kinase
VAYGRANMLESTVPDAVGANGGTTSSVEALTESLERMDDIIQDLRALAEKGQSVEKVSTVDFEAVVREAWETAGSEDATLIVDAGGTIDADRSHLLSIFENLFRNGVEHAGPSVAFRVGLTEAGFYVADDGPGIEPDERERVFEYGYTSDEDGSGLGLAIVETMITAHGWTIEVTESDSGGASFVVSGAAVAPAPTVE